MECGKTMTNPESKPREFLLKKKEIPTIDADYNAIEVPPESECGLKDTEAEKVLKYIRVIEKSSYDKLQAEIKAKDELLRECKDLLSVAHKNLYFEGSEIYEERIGAMLQKLREGNLRTKLRH